MEGSQKPIFKKESRKLNWNFQRGGRVQSIKQPSLAKVWFFSGKILQNNALFM